MGSGSSSKSSRNSAPAKYEAPPEPSAPPDGGASASADGMGNVRPCDRCGETRKTANFGGHQAQWLCAACQLASGARPTPKKIQINNAAPQPMLTRGSTQTLEGSGEHGEKAAREARRLRRTNTTMSLAPENPEQIVSNSSVPTAATSKKSRRGAKERNLPVAKDVEVGAAKPSPLKRAQTVSLEVKLSPRNDYRSSAGMLALKQQMGVSVSDRKSPSPRPGDDPASPKVVASAPPPAIAKKLGSGFSTGDQVHSLISRLRNGARVLETGEEGTVLGMTVASQDSNSEEHVRFLVQFRSGIDWYLHPQQICQSSLYSSAKTSGLPGGFMWGSRVQILVTYLNPRGAPSEIFLGYAGSVIGAGQVRGKVGVRFDNAKGELSIWPNMICAAEIYQSAVAALLPGGFQRGDRIKNACRHAGLLSAGNLAKGLPPTIESGEEGTVVGPGHAPGCVLVHFDSDERVWSLLPSHVALASGDDCI